ncbi:MAG: hypothetical protein M3P49_08755 [Actinomycetota bacterium]|nr:hypothetical protein [Actinomycetota bacterium]
MDVDRLTRVALLDLETAEAEHQEFVGHAEYLKMRRLVNEYCTAVRKNRLNAAEAAENGELPLPGLEDVREDRIAFVLDGQQVRKETMECGVEDLDLVIRDYQKRARAMEQAVIFYIALRQHLAARNATRVRDLYAA